MVQLTDMTVTMNSMKVKLNIISLDTTKQSRFTRNYYCWICGSNYTHGGKTCLSKKAVHQEEAYYKKRLGRIKKG